MCRDVLKCTPSELEEANAAGRSPIEVVLCRDVYHCTPEELDEQDALLVAEHLACLDAEESVKEQRRKAAMSPRR